MSATARAPRTLTIALPEKFDGMPSLPSANQLTRWNFSGQRWRLGKLRKAYAEAILEAKALRGVPWGGPAQRATVTIKRVAARLLDEDNLIAGTKGLLDSLVRSGVLINDRPENLILVVTQEQVVKRRLLKGQSPAWRGVAVLVEEKTP
mgnify:CR=1 FL=1